MRWSVSVTRADNGFIVEYKEDVGDQIIEKEFVFEEVGDELETMRNMLWFVSEHFGVCYSKHNSRNLVIEIQENKRL